MLKLFFLFAILVLQTVSGHFSTHMSEEAKDGIERTRRFNIHMIPTYIGVQYERNTSKNILLSALLTQYSLGTYATFARNHNVSENLIKTINFKSKKQIKETIPHITQDAFFFGKTLSLWAGKIFADVNNIFTRGFIDTFYAIFNSNVENIDFNNPIVASNYINQWGSVLTGSEEGRLVSSNMIANDGRFLHLVTNSFEGNLGCFSNPCETEHRKFHLSSDKITELPTLLIRGQHKYAKMADLGAEILEMELDMYTIRVVIPKCSDDIPDVLEKLSNPDRYDEISCALESQELNIHIPIIDINYTFNLMATNEKLGVELDLKSVLYKGVFENDKEAHVTEIRHNLHLKINAGGNCNNTYYSDSCSKTEAHTVEINKPFIMYIITKNFRIPMFGGIFSGAKS